MLQNQNDQKNTEKSLLIQISEQEEKIKSQSNLIKQLQSELYSIRRDCQFTCKQTITDKELIVKITTEQVKSKETQFQVTYSEAQKILDINGFINSYNIEENKTEYFVYSQQLDIKCNVEKPIYIKLGNCRLDVIFPLKNKQ